MSLKSLKLYIVHGGRGKELCASVIILIEFLKKKWIYNLLK